MTSLSGSERLSPTQIETLRYIAENPYATPSKCGCTVATYRVLAERKLIFVATTFASLGYPRTSAEATITDAGRAALASQGEP